MILTTLLILQAVTPPAPEKDAEEATAIERSMEMSRSTMIIDPKARADDYKKAFDFLKAEKSAAKVMFHLADSTEISNVIDMNIMPSNTLILFRYTTGQGIKFRVVEVENILGISHK